MNENKKKMDYININNSIERDLQFLTDFRLEGIPSATWAISTMKQLRANANVYEKKMAEYLFNHNVNYYTQVPFKITNDGKRHVYFADFYIPDMQTIIEIDGESHEGEDARRKDAERDKMFLSIGIRTLRIKNSEVKAGWMDVIPLPSYTNTEKSEMERKMKRLLASDCDLKELQKQQKKEETERREAERLLRIRQKEDEAISVFSNEFNSDYYMRYSGGVFCGGRGVLYHIHIVRIVNGRPETFVNRTNIAWSDEIELPKAVIPGLIVTNALNDCLSAVNGDVCVHFNDNQPGLMVLSMLCGKHTESQWASLLPFIHEHDSRIHKCTDNYLCKGETMEWIEPTYSEIFWDSWYDSRLADTLLKHLRRLSSDSIVRTQSDAADYLDKVLSGIIEKRKGGTFFYRPNI